MKFTTLTILLLALFSITLLSSCSNELNKRVVNVYYTDFSEHAKQGFFISPDAYVGQFEPVGMIQIEVIPAQEIQQYKHNSRYIGREQLTGSEMMSMLVKEAKTKGANGISHYKFFIDSKGFYVVSGFAITIKK